MPLRSDLLDPIPGDNPAGEDLRYEPVYDEIKQARFEEEDLPQGEWNRERKVADYRAVVRLAEEVLAKETKDLQVAAWLTEALLREEGFSGLRDGIALLKGLLENFWDHVYPEIDDGDLDFRAMPLSWVGGYLELAVKSVPLNGAGHSFIDYMEAQKLGPEEDATTGEEQEARRAAIEAGTVPPEDFEESVRNTPKSFYKELVADMDASLDAIRELDELGTEKFGPEAPSYRVLREAVEEVRRIGDRLLRQKLEAEPDPEPDPGVEGFGAGAADGGMDSGALPAGAPGAEAQGAASGSADPGSAAGGPLPAEPTSREDAARRVAGVARYLRGVRPTDPSPYLLLRGFRWGELLEGDDGPDPRLLEAPPTPVRTRLRGLLLDARWPELLEACEEVMATAHGRGWLDLQRYALTACDGLGAEYDTVAAGIRGALGTLLRDVPSLPSLVLMDDTPTANRETLAWLAEAGLVDAEEAGGARPPAPTRSSGGSQAVVARAAAVAREGKDQEAVALLMGEIGRASSARTRFLLQSEAARILVDSRMDAVARPILEEMHAAIERHQLPEWEAGEVVAQPLALLYRCIRRTEGEGMGEELYQTVCRLDPMLGMRVAAELEAESPPEQEEDDAGW
jgi:type VI secretion system protein ImpA